MKASAAMRRESSARQCLRCCEGIFVIDSSSQLTVLGQSIFWAERGLNAGGGTCPQ